MQAAAQPAIGRKRPRRGWSTSSKPTQWPRQLQRPHEAEAHAIADGGEELGKDEDAGERGEDRVADLGNQDEPQTRGHHHHHPTRGHWSLQQRKTP